MSSDATSITYTKQHYVLEASRLRNIPVETLLFAFIVLFATIPVRCPQGDAHNEARTNSALLQNAYLFSPVGERTQDNASVTYT